MRTRVLGEKHPDTLLSMHNLADTLVAQGDFVAAGDLLERVLVLARGTGHAEIDEQSGGDA